MEKRRGYNISDQHAMHFLTVTVVGWVDLFTRKECKNIVVDSLKFCVLNKGLIIYSYVIMPSHLHLIVRSNEGSDGLSATIRDFKKFTSRNLIKWVLDNPLESRKDWLKVVFEYHAKYNSNNQSFQVWQPGNHPKILLHPKFTEQKLNYIHANPVVAGIVDLEEEYIYSSARNYIGRKDFIMDVEIIDFGAQIGYITM